MRPSTKKKVLPPPRVRKEPPTLEEAVIAACDIATELDHQVAFAAGLMDVSEDDARPFVLAYLAEQEALQRQAQRLSLGRITQERIMPGRTRDVGPRRVVVVERRPSRVVGAVRARV